MIRFQSNPQSPYPVLAGEEGDDIGVVVNPYLLDLVSPPKRVEMVNAALAELERQRGTVIDIRDLREKRQISLLVTAVQQQIEKKGQVTRGLDTPTR